MSGFSRGASRDTSNGSFDELHALSGAYALNALDEVERRKFERHLTECELCTSDVVEFQATSARLGDAVPSTVAPPQMREAVLARARQTSQESRPPEAIAPVRSRTSNAVRWLSVAAVALVVVAGGLGALAYDNAQEAQQLTANAAAVAAVINAEDAEVVKGSIEGGGLGSLVVSRGRTEAVVVATDLSAPPAGSTYQLWAINESGARSRGLLEMREGNAAGQVISWPADATTFGMTVEPAGGSPQPTTEPILLLDVPA